MAPPDPDTFLDSLSYLFEACLLKYHHVMERSVPKRTTVDLDVRFRIEEMRLRLWGRLRGFNAPLDEALKRNETLNVPEILSLVRRLLKDMLQLLKKREEDNTRHRARQHSERSSVESRSLDLSLSEAMYAQMHLDSREGNDHRRRARMNTSAKSVASFDNRVALRNQLTEIIAVNNELEALLSRSEASALSQGLMAEILFMTLNLPIVKEDSFGPRNATVAKVIQLRQKNKTNLTEEHRMPFDVAQPRNPHPERDLVIPISLLVGFEEPQLAFGADLLCSGMGSDAPDVRTFYYRHTEGEEQGQFVLAEWRSQKTESQNSLINQEARMDRRQHLVGLLHQTFCASADFRILDCVGYILTEGQLPDGNKHPVVGFVYNYPINAAFLEQPMTLRQVMNTSYQSERPDVPELEDRLLLAHRLSLALYQLHCAGWIHQRISSHNILFFHDAESGKVDITQPYICGWRYNRPDQSGGGEAYRTNQGGPAANGLADMAIYVHPDRIREARQFRKSHDIYSLGVVLAEIAFWRPALALADPGHQNAIRLCDRDDPGRWSRALIDAVARRIGASVGARYRDAVLGCLRGLRLQCIESLMDVKTVKDLNGLEPGIEKAFFWKVVDELRQAAQV
ncbi:hypothetical protein BO70DRAFT_66072 [Aspergillus heteromorphus CBS 117.55]|uniref:Uncharacterized protein n=1 Tax=Aspergillus heteromorphus CBS 117.55 TaxID=1448321 RepID=A0A317VVV9_9EURO|nr:uncharacterized protein BO70DRAFT_66072 [Aspergillus heteromorphus CBS 117.55]PWY77441.1 hypothetical protein BO70DRAFT_66072 [Aspergillus heteromorphus CBS 117.55]